MFCVSRIRGLYLRAGAYKMGEGALFWNFTVLGVRQGSPRKRTAGDPALFAVFPKGTGNKTTHKYSEIIRNNP